MHFLLITGPPAVGKMTVAQKLCEKTGFKLFHNHHSIELALNLFEWGDPEFKSINNGIRKLVFETVSKSKSMTGFIFTLVWGFDLEEDWKYVRDLKMQFEKNGWDFHIVELVASQEIRIARNATDNRLEHKPSKRNIQYSTTNLIKMDRQERLSSKPGELNEFSFLRIDNSLLSPDAVSELIIKRFNLLPQSM